MGKKVVILGAGIIGLVLARELASKGIDTTVYDSKKRVSDGADKASGILSKKGMEESGIKFQQTVVNTLSGAVIHAGNESLKVKSEEPKAYILNRGELAEICKLEAEKSSAEVILGKRFDIAPLSFPRFATPNIVRYQKSLNRRNYPSYMHFYNLSYYYVLLLAFYEN